MLSWLIGKDSDAGRDWGQEEKGTTEDEMAGWHHWLDGRECEWTPGVGDGQGGLACCDSWGRKELDTTEWLNWCYIINICVYTDVYCSVAKSCPTLCDPTNYIQHAKLLCPSPSPRVCSNIWVHILIWWYVTRYGASHCILRSFDKKL